MTYPEFIQAWNDKTDFIICKTSGSTGNPKEISLPKEQVSLSAKRTLGFFDINRSGAVFYSCISPDTIGGKMQAVRASLSGGRLLYEVPSNRPTLTSGSPEKIDLLSVVPSQMIWLLDHADEMPQIDNILVGGAPIPDKLRQRIVLSPWRVWETYGMTETASHVALRRVTLPQSGFKPLDGVSLDTSDDGRLIVNIENWRTFMTNDIARINYLSAHDDPDGIKSGIRKDVEFEIIGRFDNVIITGGKKVHPEEVERILEPLMNHELMISSLPDDKWGNRVILIVPPDQSLTDDKIMTICKENLQRYEVPKEIFRRDVPLTANGKKQRNFKMR